MRFLSLALVCCLSVAAMPAIANANNNEKLIGKWEAKLEVDVEKLKKLLADQGTPPELVDQILPTVQEQLGNASVMMHFKEGGEMEFASKGIPGQEQTQKGEWEVVKEDGNKLEVKTTDGEGNVETNNIEFDGDDKFTLTTKELDEAPIKPPVFKRVEDDDE